MRYARPAVRATVPHPREHGPHAALTTLTALGRLMATNGGDCEGVLDECGEAGVDTDAVATRLQDVAAKWFAALWNAADGGHRLEERRVGLRARGNSR